MTVRRALRKAKMTMKTCVLRDMAPDEVRRRLEAFTASYVVDWEDWLGVAEPNRVSKFASILRSWNATRPLPMRRPKAEASHEPPYIEQLIDEAEPPLKVLGDLCVTDLASCDLWSHQRPAWALGYLLEASAERIGILRWDHKGDHAPDKWSNWTGVRFDRQKAARAQGSFEIIGGMDRGSTSDQRGHLHLREATWKACRHRARSACRISRRKAI